MIGFAAGTINRSPELSAAEEHQRRRLRVRYLLPRGPRSLPARFRRTERLLCGQLAAPTYRLRLPLSRPARAVKAAGENGYRKSCGYRRLEFAQYTLDMMVGALTQDQVRAQQDWQDVSSDSEVDRTQISAILRASGHQARVTVKISAGSVKPSLATSGTVRYTSLRSRRNPRPER